MVVIGAALALLAPGFFPNDPVFGDGTSYHGSMAQALLTAPIVDLAATPSGNGYWLVDDTGNVFSFGDARYHGGMNSTHLNRPIVGMAATPGGNGYWLVASDGGVFSFGDAKFWGSTGAIVLNKPIVGMAGTPSGKGYWLVATDGGIFSFGDAVFYGSTGSIKLNSPIAGMAGTPTGRGYWTVAEDGGIFAFGDARFYGSMGGRPLVSPVTGIATTRDGNGYWMVAEDGGIFNFGSARFLGAATSTPQTAVDISASKQGGYWIGTMFGAVHSAGENGTFILDPNAAASRAETIKRELYARINAERRARGLGALSWHGGLTNVAQGWANHLGNNNLFQHNNLGAALASPDAAGLSYLAENLYAGNGGASDSGSAHAALMHSDPHRSTMLANNLQYVGIGVVCVGNKVVVVQDFGIGSGSPMPTSGRPEFHPFVSGDEAGTGCG